MPTDISVYINQLSEENNEAAYKASDALGRLGGEEVVEKMVQLLNHSHEETRVLAARTLGLIKDNAEALLPILEAVKDKQNREIAGDLLMALEGFDVSQIYVELFRLYLFGTFKVSTVAKGYLDFKEFDISSRVIRKAEKHWNHYANNIKHDEVFEVRKAEVEEMLDDLRAFLEHE